MHQRIRGFLVVIPFVAFLSGVELSAADFPEPYNSQDDAHAAPISPQEALAALKLPEGFRATLFAAEPDVQNPIAMAWDARGRLWIAENYTYAESQVRFDLKLRDRVLIFEDRDQDGKFDQRTIFTDDVQMLTSVEVGHGGVWAMCPPQLLFIPDADGDDVPDGPAQIVLDGFAVTGGSYHNFANGLRWGPDGWLYGRCGHACPGEIGTPETPPEQRVPLRGGMWRLNPQTHQFEVLSTGTTNPWGHDWDAHGECFFINTVNGHFWHMIPGAHFSQGNSARDPDPRTYELIDQHADHWHFDIGQHWSKSRDGAANELGGGHAHSGAMVYLGGNWPDAFTGHLYTVNLHGRRLNNEEIERSESGYVAHHDKDLLLSDDPWFRGIDLSYGPDGAVTLIDWSDTGECHERNGVHRTSGRIFKIRYGESIPGPATDLRAATDAELIVLHTSRNEWHVRQARLVLTERARAGRLDKAAAASQLLAQFDTQADVSHKLRSLLTLFCVGAADEGFLLKQLAHPEESIRVWAIRLLTDAWPLDGPLGPIPQGEGKETTVHLKAEQLLPELIRLAKEDPSARVRLTLASTLQRLPVASRAVLAQALVAHAEDAQDHNLPYLVWYGLIPVAAVDLEACLPVATACTWPKTRTFIARRLAEEIETNPAPLSKLLTFTATQPDDYVLDILTGVGDALRGWRKAEPPVSWAAVQPHLEKSRNPEIVKRVRELSVVFGDGRALDEMRSIALNAKFPGEARRSALQQLVEARPPQLRKICEQLLSDRETAVAAAQGLALFDDPEIANTLIKAYKNFRPEARPQILSILTSRPAFAHLLLKAMAAGTIPRGDLTSYDVRQLHSLKDEEVSKLVTEIWGQLRDSPEEKRQQIAELKTQLTDQTLARADLSRGRGLFNETCAKCHRLFGEGKTIGPDLTGSNRNNVDYLLENIIDPSAVVNKDFRMSLLAMEDGRVLSGVIVEQTDRTLTLQTLTDRLTVEKGDIEEMQQTQLSPMPEGQLEKMTPEQIRDLIGYLRSPIQVPLSAAKKK